LLQQRLDLAKALRWAGAIPSYDEAFAPITYTSYSGHVLMDYTEVRKEQTLRLCHQ
jgi:hypothetical protein